MKILRNQNLLSRQSENIISGELSNVATVIQNPQILVEYFSIDADSSTTLDGFKNIEDYIGPTSQVVYNWIDNVPISGIDNLVSQTTFDDEVGYDEEFQSNGIIFPNTVFPKPNDCFIIKGANQIALYVITAIAPVTVRSNPFTEITFQLFTRSPEKIYQIRKQIKDEYVTTITSIGTDKTLVIKKETYFSLQDHINDYLELAQLYVKLFYDYNKSIFIYDGQYDSTTDRKIAYVDMPLWKFMFDNQIIAYDEVMTYANNNYNKNIDRIFIDSPEKYLTEHDYSCVPFVRLYELDKTKDFAEYRYPSIYEEDPRISKFTGINMIYIESYSKTAMTTGEDIPFGFIFDDAFVGKIKSNTLYTEEDADGYISITLRNAIIQYYNGMDIQWNDLSINDEKSIENYYLIPLLLGIYKKYMTSLK